MGDSQQSSDGVHIERGRRGEQLAAEYLRERGWTIEKRNFETKAGEIDIIARRELDDEPGRLVAVVEVKSRTSPGRMTPELAVTSKKRRRLTRAARYYDRIHGMARTAYRFDVVAVDFSTSPPEITHFDGAFDASGNPY